MEYEPVIGLEVHAQLLTQTKIFCSCSTAFGAEENTQTCPVCLGMPGVLPVLNKKVVEYTIKTALAANCSIVSRNRFARKNYFYPDLPKGYQISQFEYPIAVDGFLDIETDSRQGRKRIRIKRIHMEEDAGKLVHELDGAPRDASYVDFNRTGVPLIEIVSEPDIASPDEAVSYLRSLRSIVQYLEVCDGNMEQGSFRCDANISLRKQGTSGLGTKVEVKNMNSFRHVAKALEHEIQRQRAMLDDGERIIQETRLWDVDQAVTFSMRTKEEAHDYRYFPDPDLVPLVIDDAWVATIRKTLPELSNEKVQRYMADYGLSSDDARLIAATKQLAEYFEDCILLYDTPQKVCNWITGSILREVGDPRTIKDFPVTPSHLTEMLKLVDSGVISGKIAKKVFSEMCATADMPSAIIEKQGLVQVSDEAELEAVIRQVINDSPDEVMAYRKGKHKLFGYFVGQVMKATKGKANPKIVNDMLRRSLEE